MLGDAVGELRITRGARECEGAVGGIGELSRGEVGLGGGDAVGIERFGAKIGAIVPLDGIEADAGWLVF